MDASQRPRRTVLLTGASGVVGQALLGELTDHDLICLTHRQQVRGHHVRTLAGDLTRPGFGLDAASFDALAGQLDAIVHCAAITDFAAGPEATHELNVQGTAAVLALAERAQVPVHFASTAFVTRRDLTRDPDATEAAEGTARPEIYLDSKRAAEDLVRQARVPVTITRISLAIGDALSGEIAQFQGLHGIAGAVLKRALPMLPLDPDARIDFVPQDLIARAMAGLVRDPDARGEYWATAGDAALSVSRVAELVVEVGAQLGLRLDPPRLVKPDMVDRLIRPVFIDPLPVEQRRRFDDLVTMSALCASAQPFPSSLGDIQGTNRPTTEYLETTFATSMRHYAQVKGLIGAQEVLA